MGLGDELLCTGEARERQLSDPRPVAFRGKDGRVRWHPLWQNNPRISRTGEGAQWSDNRSGNRPYIRSMTKERFTWVESWRPPRGELYFSAIERSFSKSHRAHLIIEPHVKKRDGSNKDWGFARWQAVVDQHPGLPWVQLGPEGTKALRRVKFLATNDFRQACAVMAHAVGYVGPEGGLHHAAAALNKPAIVIFGGFISPAQTGYADHVNLVGADEPCGMRIPCSHCRAALNRITPEQVGLELERLIARQRAA